LEGYTSPASIYLQIVSENDFIQKDYFETLKKSITENKITPINKEKVQSYVDDWLNKHNGYSFVAANARTTLERRIRQLMKLNQIP
jgi:hypothetical protein